MSSRGSSYFLRFQYYRYCIFERQPKSPLTLLPLSYTSAMCLFTKKILGFYQSYVFLDDECNGLIIGSLCLLLDAEMLITFLFSIHNTIFLGPLYTTKLLKIYWFLLCKKKNVWLRTGFLLCKNKNESCVWLRYFLKYYW